MKEIDITDLKNLNFVDANFIDALEAFLPSWLESLVPHYEEAKIQNVELLALRNYLCLGTPPTLYEKNGFNYHLMKNEALGGMELGFESSKKYHKLNWLECFEKEHSDLLAGENRRVLNLSGIRSYMSRISNRKEPYDYVAKQVDEYFKQITGDPNVGFSLGNDSFIYFTEKAKNYINLHHYLD